MIGYNQNNVTYDIGERGAASTCEGLFAALTALAPTMSPVIRCVYDSTELYFVYNGMEAGKFAFYSNGLHLTVSSANAVAITEVVDLPEVTSADNGDVLTVVNGAWAKADPPSGLPDMTSASLGDVLSVANTYDTGTLLPEQTITVTALQTEYFPTTDPEIMNLKAGDEVTVYMNGSSYDVTVTADAYGGKIITVETETVDFKLFLYEGYNPEARFEKNYESVPGDYTIKIDGPVVSGKEAAWKYTGALIVNAEYDDNAWVPDKTYAEVESCIKAGRNVILNLNNFYCFLIGYVPRSPIKFMSAYAYGSDPYTIAGTFVEFSSNNSLFVCDFGGN